MGKYLLFHRHHVVKLLLWIAAAIRSGDLLFISGQVGSHTDGTPEPDFQKQVRLAFENLKATLTAAGCTFDDIVDVTTFHTDPVFLIQRMAVGRKNRDTLRHNVILR